MSNNHCVDNKIFRNPKDVLSDDDKAYIKKWVRENFIPNSFADAFWHPFVKNEWKKQQERFELSTKMDKLDRDSSQRN